MVQKIIKTLVVAETFVGATYFISTAAFANTQVAFISSLFVIIGSSFAYKKMVTTQVNSNIHDGERDLLDEIEDPHELYTDEPINDAPVEELDLKAIVKEEKAKIKTFSLSSLKHGARGTVSLFRIVPYIFLILGFIALKNNGVLELSFYLPSLFVGIVVGAFISTKTAA